MFPRTYRLAALSLLLGAACVGARADAPGDTALAVALRDGRLSVRAENVRLREVLRGLRRGAGIESEFLGAEPAGVIWQRFDGLPLEEALRRLLAGHSSVLYHAAPLARAAEWASASLRLLIVPHTHPGASTALPLTAQSAPAAGREAAVLVVPLTAKNDGSDSSVIVHPAGSLDALAQAMLDPDEKVRARAQ